MYDAALQQKKKTEGLKTSKKRQQEINTYKCKTYGNKSIFRQNLFIKDDEYHETAKKKSTKIALN